MSRGAACAAGAVFSRSLLCMCMNNQQTCAYCGDGGVLVMCKVAIRRRAPLLRLQEVQEGGRHCQWLTGGGVRQEDAKR